jgi:hypothetical protein
MKRLAIKNKEEEVTFSTYSYSLWRKMGGDQGAHLQRGAKEEWI